MIFGAFERMVAMRYLRARRQEGFISVIAAFSLTGIALGVATLIIVMSVMNGFKSDLLGQILGFNGHFQVSGVDGPLTNFDEMAERIRRIDGVKTVIPIVDGTVLVSGPRQNTGALVRGQRLEDLRAQKTLSNHVVVGSLDALDADSVMIGTRLAYNLGVTTGDSVTIISPQGNATVLGTVPRQKAYRVAAIFDVGMYQYDSSYVYMPLEAAQLLLRAPNAASSLEVFIPDFEQTERFMQPIVNAVGQRTRVFDWEHAQANYFNAIQTERNVMFLILSLIILVACFNIISSMIMLVKDKGRDIAILRTMGATKGMVLRIFFMTGASVGVVGTILGFILGLVFCLNIESIRQFLQGFTGTDLFAPTIYFLSRLPAKIDPTEVGVVVVMAFTLSFLATIYPSWRAARLDPVEALRYE